MADIRKIVTVVEEVVGEGGRPVEPPLVVAAAGAVVMNPLAGRFVEDLSPLVDAYCEPLGRLLTERALAALGGSAEGHGKGALVGLDGEVEHGSAIIHNLRFGDRVREPGEGTSLLPAAEKRGAAGGPDRHPAQAQGRPHYPLPPPDPRGVDRGCPAGGRDRRLGRARERRAAARAPGTVRERAGRRVPVAVARVAFIGLGTMGLPMARHLLAAGHELTCCDLDPGRAGALGTVVAATPAEAVAEADAAITSLPSVPPSTRSSWVRAESGTRFGPAPA